MSEQNANLSPEQRISAFLAPADEAPPPEAEVAQEPEASAEPVESAPLESAAPEEEGVPIEEWNQLAEYLDADPSDLYALKVSLDTPDGPEKITIEQLKDTYKSAIKFQKEANQLEAARAAAAMQIQQAATQLQAKEQQAAELLNYVENNFMQEMGRINWEQLRQTNPAEFAALRLQYQERQNHLANLKAQAAVRWEQAQREQAHLAEQYQRELLDREAKLLYAAIPEWNDPSIAEREKAEIGHFLMQRGATAQEVGSLSRHWIVSLARDAMRYQKSKGEVARNKVFKLGKKVLSPGSRTTRGEQANTETRQLRSRLSKSGNYKDAAALISKLMS